MKNILILTYWSYEEALVQTYTLPYVRIIRNIINKDSKIFLSTFEKGSSSNDEKKSNEIKQSLNKEGIQWVSKRYYPFGIRSMVKNFISLIQLIIFIKKNKITHIHAWCTPAGSFGYLLAKITGAKLIVDSYEPHAEPMVENGTWKKGGIAYRILFLLEKLQSKKATTVIGCVDKMKDYAKDKYSIDLPSFYFKPACINVEEFSLTRKKNQELIDKYNLEDKIVGVYAGKFGGIYLNQEIFDLFKVAQDKWGEKFVFLLLSNVSKEDIKELSQKSNFNPDQLIHEFVPHQQIPDYIGLGDFAITPVKPLPSKRFATPIKTGEYWAMGLPVIITKNISDDSDIIKNHNGGSVLNELNEGEYQKALNNIDSILKENNPERIRELAIKYRNFNIAEKIYKDIYSVYSNIN